MQASAQQALVTSLPFRAGRPLRHNSSLGRTTRMSNVVTAVAAPEKLERPDATGRYGKFGGKYVPETLIAALKELEQAYKEAMEDVEFRVRILTVCFINGIQLITTALS